MRSVRRRLEPDKIRICPDHVIVSRLLLCGANSLSPLVDSLLRLVVLRLAKRLSRTSRTPCHAREVPS